MKKLLSFILACIIVGAFVTFTAYLVPGKIFGNPYFLNWTNDIILGLAGATGGVFGPILAAYLSKKLRRS